MDLNAPRLRVAALGGAFVLLSFGCGGSSDGNGDPVDVGDPADSVDTFDQTDPPDAADTTDPEATLPRAATAEPATPSPEPPADPAPLPRIDPATVSDVIPSVDELLAIGLTTEQAECFIATIDPTGIGRLTDPELFPIAFSECIG